MVLAFYRVRMVFIFIVHLDITNDDTPLHLKT